MKLALVTGGCTRLGAAIAAGLAQDGWTLALHARNTPQPDAALSAKLVDTRAIWRGFTADLADAEQRSELLPEVMAAFKRAPDVLVNSAAAFNEDTLETLSAESIARHMTSNLSAPVLLARDLVAAVAPGQVPAIINILDQRIVNPPDDQLAYTLSKQALAEATRLLARVLAPRARVCGVAPGLVIPTADYTPAQLERLAARMPLGRLPSPADVADAVRYLAGARSTTGQIIFVDGGAGLTDFDRDFVFLERDEGDVSVMDGRDQAIR